MNKNLLSDFGLNREESLDDVIVPFTLEKLDCRGRIVRLSKAIDNILLAHDYPTPIARALGEAIVLGALIGSSLKFEGRLILQTQSDGVLNMLIVDFNAPDSLRAYARFDEKALLEKAEQGKISTADLLGKGHLAMTIDQGENTERYQGIVALDNIGFEEIAEQYFMQSEQIPTMVRLAVGELSTKGEKRAHWRAGGILLQHLPKGEQAKAGDIDIDKEDSWQEAKAHLSTLGDEELLDPQLSPERLLFRLYHESGVRIFNPTALRDNCSCSAERIEAMLAKSFSAKDRENMLKNGEIEVACEFCSSKYYFNPNQFESK
ncbi:MAG: Hsp33 family molecular chaperone [Devosiaceae bacterium]|nr:Hsp33 family molecular chaperone [Devosiaceae bacterium]